jgi:uncharacterized membrane protein YgdD (TMEM256/DUF423 family)
MERVLAVLAGLFGASGVALAAASAHLSNGASLSAAALMALVHAPALLGLLAARRSHFVAARLAMVAGVILAAGTLLFSGDLSMRVLAGAPLFPMAAPIGGMALIVGWAMVAVAAMMADKS